LLLIEKYQFLMKTITANHAAELIATRLKANSWRQAALVMPVNSRGG